MSNETILVVDDEPTISEVMQETLENHDYKVLLAPNGVDGLKICAEQKVDLILLDLNMPRMDGYMFMERLRDRWEKDGQRGALPEIIVLTAVDSKTDFGLAKNLGATQVMNKPFKGKELVAAVKEILK